MHVGSEQHVSDVGWMQTMWTDMPILLVLSVVFPMYNNGIFWELTQVYWLTRITLISQK